MAVGSNDCEWVLLKATSLISYDENTVPTIDEKGEIGVRKKQYTFKKRK
jgi:hypothetical protein